jgi:hypothetical protein
LSATSNYTLSCTGAGGSANASATVTVTSTPSAGTSYGLEWPGNGAVRRMLYWDNPFPIYDATYIFRVFPKGPKTGPNPTYWTTFFWGNNGTFTWDGGNANTYYGAHPYPFSGNTSSSGQNWEISVYGNDISFVSPNGNNQVVWNRWYTQAFRAWKDVAANNYVHEFYWDLPDTSKVIRYTTWSNDSVWAKRMPPKPAIVVGQAPNVNGESWGGYAGWEEFQGVIRGLQFYSGNLSVADILNEATLPQSTAAGNSLIWYLNLNPRPSDVTDKKVGGVPHHPAWDGSQALEWKQ